MSSVAFLGPEHVPKLLAARASPQIPLGELTSLPQTPMGSSKRREGEGMDEEESGGDRRGGAKMSPGARNPPQPL